MSIAHRYPLQPEPSFSVNEYCRCFEVVLICLVAWRLSRTHN